MRLVSKNSRGHQAANANVAASERKISRPSLEPSKSSQARSGCGIRPQHIALRVADAGNVVARAVWICGLGDAALSITVTNDNAIVAAQLVKSLIVADVVSLSMSDGDAPHRSLLHLIRKRRIRSFDAHVDVFTNKMQIAIADQGARQKTRFAKNLKPLQMPSTNLPVAANFFTDSITGENRARAPARR